MELNAYALESTHIQTLTSITHSYTHTAAISNFIILMPPGYTWNAFQTAYANLMKELGERTTTSTERSEYHRIYQKANGMA